MNHFAYVALAGALMASSPLLAAPATKSFNPKISLIMSAQYADYSAGSEAEVAGVALGPETELKPEGMALGEAELVLEANIDQHFHGWSTIALENEDGETVVAVEEAYIDTLAMPAGLALKFGRFLSDIGYHNRQHAHAWDFVDAPLAYRSLLANRYADDGLQVRWLAPTPVLLELGAEVMRGDGFPAGGEARSGIKAWTAFAHLGGDVGNGGAWRLGLGYLDADALDRRSGEEQELGFSGSSTLRLLDAVYKWAPAGDARERNFSFQAGYLQRRESGELSDDPDGADQRSNYTGSQDAYYLQAVYQFMRGWRLGLRYDRLSTDNQLDNPAPDTTLATVANAAGETPRRSSLMLDYSPSEFSRLRLQYNRDASRPGGEKDDQLLLQASFSLGAHPAHQF